MINHRVLYLKRISIHFLPGNIIIFQLYLSWRVDISSFCTQIIFDTECNKLQVHILNLIHLCSAYDACQFTMLNQAMQFWKKKEILRERMKSDFWGWQMSTFIVSKIMQWDSLNITVTLYILFSNDGRFMIFCFTSCKIYPLMFSWQNI